MEGNVDLLAAGMPATRLQGPVQEYKISTWLPVHLFFCNTHERRLLCVNTSRAAEYNVIRISIALKASCWRAMNPSSPCGKRCRNRVPINSAKNSQNAKFLTYDDTSLSNCTTTERPRKMLAPTKNGTSIAVNFLKMALVHCALLATQTAHLPEVNRGSTVQTQQLMTYVQLASRSPQSSQSVPNLQKL